MNSGAPKRIYGKIILKGTSGSMDQNSIVCNSSRIHCLTPLVIPIMRSGYGFPKHCRFSTPC